MMLANFTKSGDFMVAWELLKIDKKKK